MRNTPIVPKAAIAKPWNCADVEDPGAAADEDGEHDDDDEGSLDPARTHPP